MQMNILLYPVAMIKKLKYGKIHIVNTSKEEAKVVKEVLPHKHITTHYVKNITMPPKLGKVDIFVSYNNLGLMNNIPRFLKDLNKILKRGGKFCFYMKQHGLNMMPNAIIVADKKKLEKMFKTAGLEMEYTKKKGFWREEIFVHGKKK